MKKITLLIPVMLLLLASCSNKYLAKRSCTVVLSMDAFRWDYPQLTHLPTLDSLQRVGASAISTPPFPSLTFPSHYSMATGLYPDHHGIVNNTFFDPEIKKMFRISDKEAVGNGDFWKGEPIWITVKKQGLKSWVFHWVGSEAPNQGMRPDVWKPYSTDYSPYQKADSVLAWLSLPAKERPNLVMWYLYEPDHTAHDYGETGKETLEKARELDEVLNYFFTNVRKNKQYRKINFIVTSDHGMADYNKDTYINLSRHVDTTKIQRIVYSNPMMVQPKAGELEDVYQALKKVPHIQVFKRDEFPAEWHYGTNDRIYDLTILPDIGYRVDFSAKDRPQVGATHGYDHTNRRMHGIFYGVGPDFKKNYRGKDFVNINLYELIARLLHIQPAPNDGDLDNVKDMLKR